MKVCFEKKYPIASISVLFKLHLDLMWPTFTGAEGNCGLSVRQTKMLNCGSKIGSADVGVFNMKLVNIYI